LIRFILNDRDISTDLPAGTVLLDLIRYDQQLTGTKIGCREGDCGACTVLIGELNEDHVIYQSMTSCLLPLGNVIGKHVVTVEGLNFADRLNPVQQAMADCGATQCGFCTPGFVVSLSGFCLSEKEPTKENAIAAIDGNICRCTGYKSIEKAAALVAERLHGKKDSVDFVTKEEILPGYFSSIKERLTELKQNETITHHSPTIVVGGGTDLYVQKHDEMHHASIDFVFDKPALNGIRREANQCIIGPAATVSDLLHSPVMNEAFPDFKKYAKLVSSTPIRNMATIAGNFVNASPIGDFTIFFLALNAQLLLRSRPQTDHSEGRLRMIPLRKFYKDYKQLDKKPEEHIEEISFELPAPGSVFNFEKVSKRTHLDIASVNTAMHCMIKDGMITDASISAGGVGPVPLYLQKTSGLLKGKKLSDGLINEAIEVMKTEIAPISDARGSKEYKTLLLGQLLKLHFNPVKK
jgi:xanthine dehydrogenase small subunit